MEDNKIDETNSVMEGSSQKNRKLSLLSKAERYIHIIGSLNCGKDKPIGFRRNLMINRAFFLISAFFMLLIPTGYHCYLDSFFMTVYLDGEEVGMVKDGELVIEIMDELLENKKSELNMDVFPKGELILSETGFKAGVVEKTAEIKDVITENMQFLVTSYLVKIDEEPFFHLQSDEVLVELLERLKNSFAFTRNDGRVLEVIIEEEITGEWVETVPEVVMSFGEAYVLLNPLHAPQREYLVSRGDFTEDSKNNNQPVRVMVDTPGVLPGVDAIITVVTIEEALKEEEIPFETSYEFNEELSEGETQVIEEGKNGLREITYIVERENGLIISKEKQSEKIIKDPVNEVQEKGPVKILSGSGAPGTGQFSWPIPRSYDGGGRITRGFGGSHNGVDIYCSTLTSTPIIAADSGVVTASYYHSGGYGNVVVISHNTPNGSHLTVYAHNSQNMVSPGQSVNKGDVIAYMGNTGATSGRTGIHLHFEIRVGSGDWRTARALNPIDFF